MTTKRAGSYLQIYRVKINGPLMKFYEFYVNKRIGLRKNFLLNATMLCNIKFSFLI